MFFFFKQKTAYEMRISDWSSDVCSSDLCAPVDHLELNTHLRIGLHETREHLSNEVLDQALRTADANEAVRFGVRLRGRRFSGLDSAQHDLALLVEGAPDQIGRAHV